VEASDIEALASQCQKKRAYYITSIKTVEMKKCYQEKRNFNKREEG